MTPRPLTISAGGTLLSLLYSAGDDLPREWLVWLARFAARLEETRARVAIEGEREAQG